MSDEQLAALRAAAEKATPGPWTLTVHTGSGAPEDFEPFEADDWTIAHGGKSVVAMEDGIRSADDVRYIAAANPATILALLDHITKLEAGRDAVIEEVCAAIDQADEESVENASYMFDSDDCIRVARALKSAPAGAKEA